MRIWPVRCLPGWLIIPPDCDPRRQCTLGSHSSSHLNATHRCWTEVKAGCRVICSLAGKRRIPDQPHQPILPAGDTFRQQSRTQGRCSAAAQSPIPSSPATGYRHRLAAQQALQVPSWNAVPWGCLRCMSMVDTLTACQTRVYGRVLRCV